jgi:hypothetical protein
MIGTVWHDVRLAARSLARARGFTIAALATLVLGIGLTTAVYSVIDAVLVQPVPFADSERLVVLWETDRDTGTTREPGSFPDFLDYRERTKTLSDLAGFIAAEVNMIPDVGDPIRLPFPAGHGSFLSAHRSPADRRPAPDECGHGGRRP